MRIRLMLRRKRIVGPWAERCGGLHEPCPHPSVRMFDERAFRTWTHVLVGACSFSILFLGVMVMAEEVVGDGARVTRAGLTMSAAAFVGYISVAWLIRLDEARSR